MLFHHAAQQTRIINRAAKVVPTFAPTTPDKDQSVVLDPRSVGELAQAREHLSVREGLVLDLYYHEELTIQEIAIVIGINELTVLRLQEQAMTTLMGFMAKA